MEAFEGYSISTRMLRAIQTSQTQFPKQFTKTIKGKSEVLTMKNIFERTLKALRGKLEKFTPSLIKVPKKMRTAPTTKQLNTVVIYSYKCCDWVKTYHKRWLVLRFRERMCDHVTNEVRCVGSRCVLCFLPEGNCEVCNIPLIVRMLKMVKKGDWWLPSQRLLKHLVSNEYLKHVIPWVWKNVIGIT